MPQQRQLYVMLKPPADALAEIVALPETRQRAELLHITVMPLGDRMQMTPAAFEEIVALGQAIRAAPFRVVFDRMRGRGRTLVLGGSEEMRGATAFQAEIVAEMARRGLSPPFPYSFRPHLTIDYRARFEGARDIDPIGWRVEEFVLIESVVGEGRHIERGRWRLGGG